MILTRRRPTPAPHNLPTWQIHIRDTIRLIETAATDRFSRAHIEAALQIGPTAAKQLLRRLRASKETNAYSISKSELLRHLRGIERNPLYSAAIERQESRQSRIAALRPPPSAAVPIPFAPNEREQMERSTVADLPAGVYLSQNTVWLTVANLPDLTKKLGALIHALDNDPLGVEAAITTSPDSATVAPCRE